ncbi:hypothetical protein [Actinoallomurus sp. CA-150999]|uniref:hypothetical protein n=1 Tax=Actinoallomurus sp. CA-150999 TaxID=3239887 RepID=UPI003D8C5ADF
MSLQQPVRVVEVAPGAADVGGVVRSGGVFAAGHAVAVIGMSAFPSRLGSSSPTTASRSPEIRVLEIGDHTMESPLGRFRVPVLCEMAGVTNTPCPNASMLLSS